ncbi:uncharacterized protein LOC124937630 [Impatiens glandulifera]|uniref:uncharacterized protein LOC124937630 n=1 Tax=Impatiens glandulifera TaxID=253017 RepID=UPI001FB0F7D4|nr:uncharacterized protein LOC124937630 [Impatiens glandulifera]XP_047333880.1 uncharacterized protein LOC124937630 [Impatiens glandulifera]
MIEKMTPHRTSGLVDPGWEHGIAQDDRKKKVRCNYCGKVVSGGIYRLKQHLARISGEVTYCDKAPEEVCLKMRENLEGSRLGKRGRHIVHDEQPYLSYHNNENGDEEEQDEYNNSRGKGKQVIYDKASVLNMTPLRSLGYVDPGWEHGVAQDERKKKVKCNYCEKIVSGGINRFKQHLARIPGEVAPCKNAPDEVYHKIKDNMKWHRTGRRHRRPDSKDSSSFYMPSDNDDDEDEQDDDTNTSNERSLIDNRRPDRDIRTVGGFEPIVKKTRLEYSFIKPYKGQTSTKTGSSKRHCKEVVSAIAKFFYHAGVPSQAANSTYFHKMLETVGQYGQDLVIPSSRMMSGRCLQEEMIIIKNYLAEYRSSWANTGCSILADSWRDSHGQTMINFLVSCPRGIHFVCSVDATDIIDDADSLFKLLDKMVEDMGEENVVQVITDCTPSYQAAGKMLEERRTNLFWTPCAAYCMDRVLADFMGIKIVGECIEKAQKITKFIYSQHGLLHLMRREFTEGQDLLKLSFTQYSSSFATLKCLSDSRVCLKKMFQSSKWLSSHFSKSNSGKEVEKIILNPSFWKRMQFVNKTVEPIMQIVQKVNSDESLSMSYIYSDLCRAKLQFENHGNDEHKYGPFLSVIENHWKLLFQHPLYGAAYFLNPSIQYQPEFVSPNPEVVRGLNSSLVRLETENTRRVAASMQISDYTSAKADFGTDLAISTRTELNPAAWWQQHGINCLELQRISVRILSQTCSSFGCEHSWSIYDQIHRQKRNRLAQKRQNDYVYVHYNLRLRERQIHRKSTESAPLDNVLLESLLYDWIIDDDDTKLSLHEDEEIICSETDQAEVYENDLMAGGGISEDIINGESRKECLEMVTLGVDVEPLDVKPSCNGDDDDADLNFLDDDLSDG